jgi:cation diffusion facilitator CzcD-associated flavoprotein CzcO
MSATDAFSPDVLRQRYRLEREKRLRPEGVRQYVDISAFSGALAADPFVDPNFTRPAVEDEVDVVIVGGGFGGMLAAVRQRQAGVTKVRIIEKGGDFGGTWYWNRYPGAACDVISYLYLPLLEETGYVPTEKYAKAPEIFAYAQAVGRKYDLYAGALFQTEVKSAAWDAETRRWRVTTDRGDDITTRFLVVAGGILHKPKLPGIPGIETFQGHSFHTSRWDYAYTGGGPRGGMDKLADKRVGVIGTGATTIQAAPALADSAKELFVFQRTPSSVRPRDDGPTAPDWAGSRTPGWQKRQRDNFVSWVIGPPIGDDMTRDGWSTLVDHFAAKNARTAEEAQAAAELADFREMEAVRAWVDEIVKDPATAEALKPWYKQMCKRPCFHDTYLETFNRPNVKLVDTKGKGVERITPKGVVVEGVEYELDCLIYASGFDNSTSLPNRLGFDLRGRDGLSLSEDWAEEPKTLHGLLVRNFPNLLIFGVTQGGQNANYVHVLDDLSVQTAYIVRRCLNEGIETIEPDKSATDAWRDRIIQSVIQFAAYNADCTPGYYNGEGSRDVSAIGAAAFMESALTFGEILKAWREADDFSGLIVAFPGPRV